jgi:hypothetical protein
MGTQMVVDVLPKASPEVRGALASSGLSVAEFTMVGAWGVASSILVFCVLGGALVAVVRGGERSSRSVPAIVLALSVLGALGAALASALGGPIAMLIGPATALSGACLALAAWRYREEHVESDAAHRVFVALSGVALVGVLGLLTGSFGDILALDAAAKASAETKSTLIANGLEVGHSGRLAGLVGAGALFLGGVVAVVPVARALLGRRSILTAVLTSVALFSFATPLLLNGIARAPVLSASPLGTEMADLVDAFGPVAEGSNRGIMEVLCVVRPSGKSWELVSRDGLGLCPSPFALPVLRDVGVGLLVPPTTRAASVTSPRWFEATGTLHILTSAKPVPGAGAHFRTLNVGTTPVRWGPTPADAAVIRELRDGFAFSKPGQEEPTRVDDPAAALADLERLSVLALRLGGRTTVQQVVDLCTEAQHRGIRCLLPSD